jgi:hypothetical protein
MIGHDDPLRPPFATHCLWVALSALVPLGLGAQDADVQASIACFKEVHAADDMAVARSYQCPSGAVPAEVFARGPEHYGHEAVQSLLDELVHVGLTTDSDQVQVAVCQALHGASRVRDGHGGPRVPGVVERLEALFFSGRAILRVFCVGVARNKADRLRMIEFLKRIASEENAPDAHTQWPASYRALESLETLGAEGRAAIQELVATEAIHSGRARWLADRILERGPGNGGG